MSNEKVSLILGTMTFGESVFEHDVTKMIEYFVSKGYTELDTAYVYNNGQSEELIGHALETVGRDSIKISTKVNPRITGRLDGNAAKMQLNESLKRLGVDYVDTFYLHFPDRSTPVESVLEGCAELHMQGKFKELGISNFPAWLVADVYHKCKANGWVLPTVYEGMYNPITRRAEGELNEALDYFGLRFTAYNPLAGGLLTNKYKSFSDAPSDGRFTHRPNYQKRYWKESYFNAVAAVKEICAENSIDIIEASYRWLAYHSMLNGERGDAIIVGISKLSQLQGNIAALSKGELPESVVNAFENAWQITKSDCPEYFRFYGTAEK